MIANFFRLRITLALLLAAVFLSTGCNLDPNYAKLQYVKSGNKYYERGKYKEALIMYRKALLKDPKYGDAFYRVALTYHKLGQEANSVGPLRRAVEQLPKNTPDWNDAALRLAEILIQAAVTTDAPARAKPLMDEVASIQKTMEAKNPNGFEVCRIQADLKRADASEAYRRQDMPVVKKDLEDAIALYRKSVAAKPSDVETNVALARTLTLYGEIGDAEQIYRSLIERDKTTGVAYSELYRLYVAQKKLPEAEQILKKAIAANPTEYTFLTMLASHYFQANNRSEMQRTLDQLKAHYKDFPAAYTTAGDFYVRINDLDMAVKQYQEGEQKEPNRKGEYEKRMIEVLLREGKKQDAYNKNLEMLKNDPKDADARGLKGSFLLDRGEVSAAISELEAAVTAKPDNFVAHYNLGRAHYAKQENEQAIQQYRESIRLRPDFVRPRIALSEVYLQQKDYDAALKNSEDTLKMAPGNASAQLLQAVALMHLNRRQESRTLIEDLLKRQPQFPEAYLEYGVLNLADRKLSEAQTAFHKSYELAPQNLRGLQGETEVFFQLNQGDKALALLQKEVAANPNRPEVLRELANAKLRAGQFDAAMSDYRVLLEKDKDNPREEAEIYASMGQVQARKGDIPAAINYLEKARLLQPTAVPLLNFLAQSYDRVGRKQEAMNTYKQVLANDPNDAEALNNLAFVMAETGTDLDQALTFANRAKQRLPSMVQVSDTIGWIYLKKNMGDQAVQVFRQLTAAAPDNPTFHYHYCMALAQKGDKINAQKECNAALSRKPTADEEKSVRAQLAKL